MTNTSAYIRTYTLLAPPTFCHFPRYSAGEEELDDVVITEMAKYYNVSTMAMEHLVREWQFDHITSEYFLLQLRITKGHHIRLPAKKGRLSREAQDKLHAHPMSAHMQPMIR